MSKPAAGANTAQTSVAALLRVQNKNLRALLPELDQRGLR